MFISLSYTLTNNFNTQMKCSREAVRGGGGKGSMNDKKRKGGSEVDVRKQEENFIHWENERKKVKLIRK